MLYIRTLVCLQEVGSTQGFKLLVLHAFSLQVNTIKVSNVSLGASEQDIKEFFSFSGDIEYVEMKRSVVCWAWWSTILRSASILKFYLQSYIYLLMQS